MIEDKQKKTSRGRSPEENDAMTQALLRKLSINASTVAPFMPGPTGRIAGDVGLAGSQKTAAGLAFHPDMPREDRMNGLLSSAATMGMDLTTDAGLAALIAFLQSKKVPGSNNPNLISGAFYGKQLAMNPVYEGTRNAIFDNNIGTKTADAIKLLDNFANMGQLQGQYAQMLPMLEDIASRPEAAEDVTSPAVYASEKKVTPGSFIKDSSRILLPKNVQPTADQFGDTVDEVAGSARDSALRSIAGGKRDVKKVMSGMTPMARLFSRNLRKTITDNLPMVTTGRK